MCCIHGWCQLRHTWCICEEIMMPPLSDNYQRHFTAFTIPSSHKLELELLPVHDRVQIRQVTTTPVVIEEGEQAVHLDKGVEIGKGKVTR